MQSSPSTTSAAQPGCLHYLLFALAAAWIMAVVTLVQGAAWIYDQFAMLQGTDVSAWFWLLVAVGQALLLALPIVPLARLTVAPRLRAAYTTWMLAIGLGALFSLPRLFPVTWTQPAAIAQIILALLASLVLSKLRIENAELRKASILPARFSIFNSQFSIALAVVLLTALPWFHYGALGSPLDTLLNLLAGLSLGLVAGQLLWRWLVTPFAIHSAGHAADIGLGGFAAGIALLILSAGFGFGGSQILLLLALPALGFAAMALARFAAPPLAPAWERGSGGEGSFAALVGMAAAAPLVFIDPDEFTLLLGLDANEVVGQALRAAGLSILLAWVLGLALWALAARGPSALPRGLAFGGLATAGAIALLVYFLAGRPGFYGERLFVVLRDQADVSAAAQIVDRTERTRYVYTTLTQQADRTQAGLRATLDRFGIAYRPYYLVNAIEVEADPPLRAYLAAQPEVDRVLDSPQLRPLPGQPVPSNDRLELAPPDIDSPPPPSGPQWNISMIGADRVWNELNVTGEGIVLGESDSGVQGSHPALRDGYRGRNGQDDYNWLDPWNATRSPTDIGGHGTHTTGTAVGRGGIGVAPGAEWIGCVNLARNLGNPPAYLECMQFMLAPYAQGADPFKDGDPARAAHVLNNSWGCPPLEGCDPGALAPATRALRAAGIFVVASAGNEGPRCGTVSAPIALYDDVFSVGAIDQTGTIADFSSRGPVTVDGSERVKPDIIAPGVDILSSLPGSTYGPNDGTSMAGPHVAGVVALIWSANPKLIGDIDRTEQIITETAQPYDGVREGCFEGDLPNNAFGYGVVDAYAAVQAALGER
jgi:subtilisin family serine protease